MRPFAPIDPLASTMKSRKFPVRVSRSFSRMSSSRIVTTRPFSGPSFQLMRSSRANRGIKSNVIAHLTGVLLTYLPFLCLVGVRDRLPDPCRKSLSRRWPISLTLNVGTDVKDRFGAVRSLGLAFDVGPSQSFPRYRPR